MRPALLEVNLCKTSNSRSLPQLFWKPLPVISSLWARQSLTNIYEWTLQLGSWMPPFVPRPLRPGSNTMVNTFTQWRTPPESQKHLKLNLHACSCFTGLEKCGYDTVIKKQIDTHYNHCLTAKKTVLQNYQQNCPEAKFLNTEETCTLKIAQATLFH